MRNVYQPLLANELCAIGKSVPPLLTFVEANVANKMTPAVMLIHLFAKNRSAAPVGLADQKYVTSRSKVIIEL